MDTDTLRARLEAFYHARVRNDLEATLTIFSEDAVIHYAGDPAASDFARRVEGAADIAATCREVVDTWRWESWTALAFLVDGNEAMVRSQLVCTHAPSGRQFETQLVDHWVFDDDGKARAITEFTDMALPAHLLKD